MADYPELETVALSALAGSEATVTGVREVKTKYGQRFVVEMNSTGGEEAEAQTWVDVKGRRGDILRGIAASEKPTKVRFEAVETGYAKPFVSIEVV